MGKERAAEMEVMTCALIDLFWEQAEGYVNALEISTSPSSTVREIFEHYGRMPLYEE